MKRGPTQIAHALGSASTRLLNAFAWGSARQSFSARTGYALYRGKRWAKVVAPVIDFVLRSHHHCVEQAKEAELVPHDWEPA